MAQKYRLNILGWYNFERLVQTLLKEIIGPGVTSFGGSRDGGRDAKFEGSASYPNGSTQWSGYWIFQVKFIDYEEFTPNTARSRLKTEARKEFQQIIKENRKKSDNYILITNISLTSSNRKELNVLANKCGIKGNFAVIDGNEICEFLDIHPAIRQSHPQLLGLADLQLLINPDIYARSKFYFNEWSPQMGKFVETEAYLKALNTIKNYHFAVIDGPPEAGKSMIAAACAFVYSADGFQIDVVREPTDFLKIRGLDEEGSHLFIADDAVGSLTFDPGLTERWSQEFSKIFGSLDAKHKLIWTARSYILKEAIHNSRLEDKITSFPGIHEILVEVSELSILQKAEILYKHAKNGTLKDSEKKIIKENAEKIVNDSNFTPERIRQLINDYIPSQNYQTSDVGILDWRKIHAFLKNPGKHWEKAYNQLHESEKILLSAMLDFENFAKINELKASYDNRVAKFEGEHLPFNECLDRLVQSFLKVENYPYYGKSILFQHPSLRDLLLLKIQNSDRTLSRHIEMASPVAVSEIIRGFGKMYAEKENIDRLISIHTDEQFEKLLNRIDDFSAITCAENEWNSLLASLEILLPKDLQESYYESGKIDLKDFVKSREYKIILHALSTFGKFSTYENGRHNSDFSWVKSLEKFYYLSHFVEKSQKIEYLHDFYSDHMCFMSEEILFDFICLMEKYEPIFYRQIKAGQIEYIRDYVKEQILEKIVEGNILDNGDSDENRDETPEINYKEWYSETDNLLAFAQQFYKFTGQKTSEEDTNFRTLDHQLSFVSEPKTEASVDLKFNHDLNDRYWTISKIFEDL
jgi:hypothetical protein